MFEAFVQGLFSYAQIDALFFLLLGTCIGIFVGMLPAVGGLVAMALLLPVTFGMDRVAGISFLVAISAITSTGGSITAILMNIPGTEPSAATLIDGFPMTQRGEAGRALGAMLAASGMGAILGVFMALGMIPIIRPFVMRMGKPELFFIIFMGISFLAVLSKGSMTKGMISGFLGIFLGLIGFQESTGVERFTFGYPLLLYGLELVPVVLGLFAGAELLDIAVSGESIIPERMAQVGKTLRRALLRGMREVFQHLWLWFRSCILGYVIGIIPGIGGSTAVFVSYAQAKQTSKNPEKFGTGCIEGIIAPESASNAKEGGALLTTLALGMPGSATMALILGALLMHGVIPGPEMIKTELTLTFTLLWGLAIANLFGGILCYIIVGYFNLTGFVSLHPRYLVPIILTVTLIGAFASSQHAGDVMITLIFTLVGSLMKKYGYNRPAMLLGFILGIYFEEYLWLSLQAYGFLFFLRPGSLVIIAFIIGLYCFAPLRSLVNRRRERRLTQ